MIALTGCTSPDPEATPDASPTSASPEPQPTVAEARVPLDGDCAAVLPDAVTAEVFEGGEVRIDERDSLVDRMSDLRASLARLGGLTCAALAETANVSYLEVTIVPASAVPAEIGDALASFNCDMWVICGRAETRSGMWVMAGAAWRVMNEYGLAPEEEASLRSAADAAIEAVFAHPEEDLAGIPRPDSRDWAMVPPCEVFAATVPPAVGMTEASPGFPSDYVPSGPLWEILVANGVATWCAWYEFVGEDSIIAELQLHSGVGAPTPEQLADVRAQPIEVAGADAAYRIPGQTADADAVLVLRGPNRVLVGGDRPDASATAALTALG